MATPPGQSVVTRMFFSRSSRSSAPARPTWANLVAAYTASSPAPRSPATDATMTMSPLPFSRKWGTAALIGQTVPATLVSIISSSCSSVRSMIPP